MKIQWLNDERTRAIVTRGRWWWKRQAAVRKPDEGEYNRAPHWPKGRWVFEPSGDPADEIFEFVNRMHNQQRARDKRQQAEERNWRPVADLPEARVRRLT